MIDKIDKVDRSFIAKNKSWFKPKLGGIDVESINKVVFKDLFDNLVVNWHKDSVINNAMYSAGFDTFDRGAMVEVEVPFSNVEELNKNKTLNTKNNIMSSLNNNLTVNNITTEVADVVVNGHSLSDTANKVDGLDMIVNDMRGDLKDLKTKIDLLESRVNDADCARMDIKSLIDKFFKETFAGASYDEFNKKLEFWNSNRESLGGIILK